MTSKKKTSVTSPNVVVLALFRNRVLILRFVCFFVGGETPKRRQMSCKTTTDQAICKATASALHATA